MICKKLPTVALALALALCCSPAIAQADDALPLEDEEVVVEQVCDIKPVEEPTQGEEPEQRDVLEQGDVTGDTGDEVVTTPDGDDTAVAPTEGEGGETPATDDGTEDEQPADVPGSATKDDATGEDEEAVEVPATTLDGGDGTEPGEGEDPEPELEPWQIYNPADDPGANVYRLYNRWTGEHFYTMSLDEAKGLVKVGWNWEGTGWVAPSDSLVEAGWVYESVGWYSYYDQLVDGKQVLRQYNPYATSGAHNFTTSQDEANDLVAAGWVNEGTGWNSMDRAPIPFDEPFWVCTDGGDRWWVQTDTNYAKDRLITPAEGAGYYAYARSNGAVIRGRYDAGEWNYFADKTTGELPSTSGWVTTSDFGQGNRRYWLENGPLGILGSKDGYSTGGYAHYTLPNAGYVLTGKKTVGSYVYLADSTGKLANSAGWLTTSAYDNGTSQRYYLEACPTGGFAAKTDHFTVSGTHYLGLANKGYVQRGKVKSGSGFLLADPTTGAIRWTTGWYKTSAFDSSEQWYYVDAVCADGLHGARTGFFTVNGDKYYAYPSNAHIAYGHFTVNGENWYANSNGKITLPPSLYPDMLVKAQGYSSATGWLILVDCTNNHCAIYQGGQGHWVPVKEWLCTTGAAGTPTKKGVFTVQSKGYSFGNGYTCYYYTQFYGDFLFHSVLYYPGTFQVMDGRLGIDASHGCVRLALENAKYIYDNVPRGTTVVTYSAS